MAALGVAVAAVFVPPEARGASLAAGAVVGVVVGAGTRWLLRPVQVAAAAAGRIAASERGVRVEARGPDEIAALARAVNALAHSVEAREDEIQGRLQVVAQLTSMMAHEVRNPLQSLALLCALARIEPDAARRGELLAKIEGEILHLEAVVQRILRSSGPLQVRREPADLVDVVQAAVVIAEAEARARRVRLLVHLPGRLAAVVDASLVRRAIENLVLNAVHFAAEKPPGQVTVALRPRSRSAVLVVEDDGPGVPPGDREAVFQPFVSRKPGGTGLGLALVSQVVRAHGGSIRVDESPLGGARFEAVLPLDAPESS